MTYQNFGKKKGDFKKKRRGFFLKAGKEISRSFLGDSLPSEEKKHIIIFFPGFHGNQDGLKSRLAFPKKSITNIEEE